MTLLIQAVACVVVFLWASFFEWFIHRNFMHARRFPLEEAYRGHTLLHHQIYHGERFFAKKEDHPPHLMLRPITFPSILLLHVPFFLLFEWLTGISILWGGSVACVLYYVGYEYTHYLMHVPAGHFVERFRWFQFLREHHRLHHTFARRNYNVFVPLADACLGTLVTSDSPEGRPRRSRRSSSRKKSARRL
ncbi:MAG TPA: sterol desaturase family protein [Armatimonadota bacterium]|nr:sterol desaturase family protein [Armatimonadota bacterium]